MGKALYRKYRSRSLDEIVGQSHITALLQRAIANGNVAHAYLLTGPKGVGKTSIARILAHEINGLPYSDESIHLDIIEIDAASNNSVEDIRNLRDKVMVAPAVAKKKIYIIDEVHMLSKSAFNALLKTLEEPPEHVVFILATTDAEKLPATIISRVQRFNFRTIGTVDATNHLRTIADAENIAIDDTALELIARSGKGSFRDSISMLDQLQSLTDDTITQQLIENVLGLADTETVSQLLAAYEQRDIARVASLIADAESRGTPAIVLADQLIQAIRTDIAAKPYLLPLLDKLLDISKSAWPHVKLLTALASNENVAIAPAPTVTDVEKKAFKKEASVTPNKPSDDARSLSSEARAEQESSSSKQSDNNKRSDTADERHLSEKTLTPSPAKPETSVLEETVPNKRQQSGNSTQTPPPTQLGPDQPFPWSDYIADIKPHSTGIFTLLGKSGHHFDGSILTIYAGKPFTKKQIDKLLPQLASSLEVVGVKDGTVLVLDTPAPVKNSQSAAILDIMGGGEEVSL